MRTTALKKIGHGQTLVLRIRQQIHAEELSVAGLMTGTVTIGQREGLGLDCPRQRTWQKRRERETCRAAHIIWVRNDKL